MAILIDGYNLLHASGILARGVGPGTLERARNALLNFLAESLEAEELRRTTVVFDARTAPPGLPRVLQFRGMRVHFAPNPGDADALIEDLIRADHSPRKLTVVSADHRLQRAAKRRRATALDSDIWYAQVVRRRAGQPQSSPADVPKPAGPLSELEVSFWLRKFGMAEAELRDEAAAQPSPGTESPSVPPRPWSAPAHEKPDAEQLPGNPFPPGYAEDLLEGE